MTREERLKYCTVCDLKGFNPTEGTICTLTGKAATFATTCPDFRENEKAVVLEQKKHREQEEEISKTINWGRYTLIIIGAIFLLLGIIEMFAVNDYSPFRNFIFLTIGVTFFTLAAWSHKNTVLANTIGLVLFIVLVLIEGIIDPSRLLDGFAIGGYSCAIFALIAAIITAKKQSNGID